MATEKPMSHAHLLCIFPWLTLGGADKLNLDLLIELHARGWRITIITTLPSTNPWRTLFAPLCEEIIALGNLPPQQQPYELVAQVQRIQPSWVLISHSAQAYHMLPALRQAAPTATFLDLNHIVDPHDVRGGYPALSLDQSQLLDAQLATSETLRDWMLARGGDPQRIHVCLGGVDTGYWDAAHYDRAALRDQYQLPAQAFVGLYPARLERVKQPYLALRLMAWLVRRVPDAYFLIAGDGSYMPMVRSYVRTKGLGRHIQILGAVAAERMPELYAVSDLMLLPSQMEGLSVAIHEAMAMGLVPLSVAAGGQAELVTPEYGVLIKRSPREEQEYRAALYQLATDRSRLQRMGQAGAAHIRDGFRRDQYAARFEQILQIAHASHQAGPRPAITPAALAQGYAASSDLAERDALWYGPRVEQRSLRSQIKRIYWWLIRSGAWWLLPLLDRLRYPDSYEAYDS